MKILKMKLENFQGVKELEIDPQGESSAIYGDNGTGKSTVYNAFTWLMYGKPSTTEKNYTPKTTGSHNLHHSVEMTVELADGSEMVLKKDYHEVYKTIKGNPQPVLSGHTTDYSMDGVPVSETQFKKNLLEIYHDEELAKMLTSYNYFLENMKVADRRKILLQVCGDADFNEVIESQGDLLRELPEMLRKPGKAENYYTVDEYRAIAAKEKNLTDKELDDIPQRIDEAEKAKPDVTGLDAQTIDNTMAEIKEKRRELESQRAARESGATTTIRQQIAELESQRAAGEAKHVRAESEANKGTYERISNLRYMVTTGAFITPDGNGTTANSIKIDATGTGGAQWCKTITKTSENFSCALGALTCSADISDAAKAVLRAYGLLPVDGAKASDYDDDRLWFNNVADERLFGSGGIYGSGAHAGVGCSSGNWTNRGSVYVHIGWRSAYVDLESVGL